MKKKCKNCKKLFLKSHSIFDDVVITQSFCDECISEIEKEAEIAARETAMREYTFK